MTIADICLDSGAGFNLECRIRHPLKRIASNGCNYLAFTMEDSSGSIRAYAWESQCDISCRVHDLDKVVLGGRIREFDGRALATIQYIRPGSNDTAQALTMIPNSICPEPQLLHKLRVVVERVKNEPLKQFLYNVFADDGFALPFVRLPASRHHHHAVAGGLLRHSLECVEMVRRFAEFSPDMLDLAVTGALLHDAGKIVTLRGDKFCLEGVLLDHDALTLEVLAPHLRQLDRSNRDAAVALRYLWTWHHYRRGMNHPALTVAEAIAAVDRISAGLDSEGTAFTGRPDWQTVVRSETGGHKYWRPRLEYGSGRPGWLQAQA